MGWNPREVAARGMMSMQDRAAIEAEKRLIEEKRSADADMAVRFANLHMPDDIRGRAKAWGMEAFFEVLWNSAFQAGYREAVRDRAEERGEGK